VRKIRGGVILIRTMSIERLTFIFEATLVKGFFL